MNPYYSIFINIGNRRCIVIGGGQVALRKVRELLVHGAKISVVSPRICRELAELAERGEIQVIQRNYRAGDISENELAIVATGDKRLNQRSAKEAKLNRVLVNVVDDPELSDFIVPSVLHRGNISIAVSTAGQSPALARKIRTRLEKQFAQEYAALAGIINDIRAELTQKGIRVTGDEWQNVMDLDILIDLLKNKDEAGARNYILNGLKISNSTDY